MGKKRENWTREGQEKQAGAFIGELPLLENLQYTS